MNDSFDRIPIVDTRTTTDRFARAFGEALLHTGFACVVNTHLNPALVTAAYEAARRIFDLPLEAKMQYTRPEIFNELGYTPPGKEHAEGQTVGDLKEFWHTKRHDRTDNVWPAEVPEFRSAAEALFAALEQESIWLLSALDKFLGVPSGTFARMTYGGESLLRLLWYWPLVGGEEGVRSAAHRDINLITLLPAATNAGLQVQNRADQWIDVDAPRGALIVNVGDMLEMWTRSYAPHLVMPSTTHQVVNVFGDGGRMSAPFFVHPRAETLLRKDPPFTAGAFLAQRLREIGLA